MPLTSNESKRKTKQLSFKALTFKDLDLKRCPAALEVISVKIDNWWRRRSKEVNNIEEACWVCCRMLSTRVYTVQISGHPNNSKMKTINER